MRIPSNKIADVVRYFRDELKDTYEKSEIEAFIAYCFEEYLNLKRADIFLNFNSTISESELLKFNFAIKDLKQYKPLQYIIGKADFYGLKFIVNRHVLIPRPETEELVQIIIENCGKEESRTKNQEPRSKKEEANIKSQEARTKKEEASIKSQESRTNILDPISNIQHSQHPISNIQHSTFNIQHFPTSNLQSHISILDIGTGSGCIPIALKKNIASSNVYAVDISAQALDVAKKNANLNNVHVDFFQLDILSTTISLPAPDLKFDIIVSNPPYICSSEKLQMQKNVLDFEPHLALFVNDEDPLLFYNAIADFALKYLKKNGKLYFEINRAFGSETKQMLEKKGFKNIILKKDINNNYRILYCNI